jgi:hypothetical protein
VKAAGWRAAWINDLQGGRLESGVFIGSPGRPLVEQALARLAEERLKFGRPAIVAGNTGSLVVSHDDDDRRIDPPADSDSQAAQAHQIERSGVPFKTSFQVSV